MNRKQMTLIALLCAIAAVLAAMMLWRAPGGNAASGEHAGHQDSHGHDDRHAEAEAPQGDAGHADDEAVIAMSAAQIKANGIALDTAGPATIRETLHLPAQVKVDAEKTVALSAPAAGVVRAVPVSVGTPVARGQALVIIASPEAARWRAEHGRAQARLRLARSTHAREQALWEQRISARQDLEAAENALREAEIEAAAARQGLDALGIPHGIAPDGASALVTVRAPRAGVVLDKPVVAGQSVDASTALLTLADLSQVWIEAAVPAQHLAGVASGMPAKVSINAEPAQRDAIVSFVGPTLGETTRMATARVALPNPGRRLRPGMLATVDLLGQAASVPVAVASAAIQTIHERSVVFVRTAAGFEPRNVVLGRSDGKRTEIVEGLAAGASYAAGNSFLLKAELGKAGVEHGH